MSCLPSKWSIRKVTYLQKKHALVEEISYFSPYNSTFIFKIFNIERDLITVCLFLSLNVDPWMNLDRYEMAHIITCVGCGKTWLLVSSAHLHLFIYASSYIHNTWTRLGEQLWWCWTICHSSVFIADIHILVPVPLYNVWWHSEPQFVTNTSVDVYLHYWVFMNTFVEDGACG